jgi:carbonic anhydrase
MNSATRPELSAFERRGLISKQFPSVAVLGCSDSRVPTEIVFDQGLGDLFVIRVAGNCLATSTMASLQYAINHLKVKVVVVLGHEACGAVKAAQLPSDKLEQEPSELEQALKGIKAGLDVKSLQHIQDVRAHDREAVTTNVKRQVERLARDKGMMSKVRQQDLMVVGAFYEISSGIVDFFHEVSGPQPDCSPVSPGSPKTNEMSFKRMPSHGVKSRYEPEQGA